MKDISLWVKAKRVPRMISLFLAPAVFQNERSEEFES
jgi:hypothetical protein